MRNTRNRHRKSNLTEVWDSWEWLYREQLERLDSMTRQMIWEMTGATYKGYSQDTIRRFVQERFTELWNRVAEEQETGGRKAE